jgi:hypothetical protein
MGLCGTKDSKAKNNEAPGEDDFSSGKKEKQKEVKTTGDFLKELDFVTENKVRITKEYNVLSPPLGRGTRAQLFHSKKKL